ncbi:MAG: IclR family transcriptional regulator domain-containing protein [Burkholderiales bacterium]
MPANMPRMPKSVKTTPALPLRDTVQSLERGLAVIRSLGDSHGQTLADVAKRTGMTRAAARRFLLTLEALGYVGRHGNDFHLLPKTLELGYSYLASQSLAQVAQPHLQKLANELGESCSVLVLDRHSIIYVARVTVNRLVGANLSVGSTLPAYCTSAGRLLLAALPEAALRAYLRDGGFEKLTPKTLVTPAALRREIDRARRQGWYLINEELEHGARALSVPLHDDTGGTIAAINLSCYAGRVQPETMTGKFLPRMLAAAEAIDAEMRVIGGTRR